MMKVMAAAFAAAMFAMPALADPQAECARLRQTIEAAPKQMAGVWARNPPNADAVVARLQADRAYATTVFAARGCANPPEYWPATAYLSAALQCETLRSKNPAARGPDGRSVAPPEPPQCNRATWTPVPEGAAAAPPRAQDQGRLPPTP